MFAFSYPNHGEIEFINYKPQKWKISYETNETKPLPINARSINFESHSIILHSIPLPLPPFLSYLHFPNHFNQSVDSLHLPPTLTSLVFGDTFNQPVTSLPPSLIHLSFGFLFNQNIDSLPHSLKSLELGFHFTHSIDNIPDSITSLSMISPDFNPVITSFPSSLKKIHFDTSGFGLPPFPPSLTSAYLKYCPEFISLPLSLTRLHASNCSLLALPPHISNLSLESFPYQQFSIISTLPLTILKFGDRFNHSVDSLPNSLTELYLGKLFNKPVDHLPSQLKLLVLGQMFNQLIDLLPISLTHLEIEGILFDKKIQHLPPQLTHLKLGFTYKKHLHLPSTLTSLHLWSISLKSIPDSLQILHLNQGNIKKWDFPASLTHISIGCKINTPLLLPENLKTLFLGNFNSYFLSNGKKNSKKSPATLPPSLTSFHICGSFNQPILSFPYSLKNISLVGGYNQPFPPFSPLLSKLMLPDTYTCQLPSHPKHLTPIYFIHDFR